ncbi:FAD binding domain-containing protein [Nakamurella leprariae]|uniref:FAD binding domain-containing protein n=1 Tax=Nakamurella leprariae TaxID=2803911 RepID=A0A939BXY9_9ACTN|nr:FAD binding domain-containing protein [Nakamurella leprariae]MBM9466510.1 FAD binding domain-containing protein [Nakamurella leprariae]
MDINTVTGYRRPTRRSELLPLAPGEAVLAGGSWLFSEPQPGVQGLVDLDGLGWPSITDGPDGLTIAATCTIETLAAWPRSPQRPAVALFRRCAHSLLGSFKVHRVATVGGNLCMSLPAGPMISLTTALDGTVQLWSGDEPDRLVPVTEFVLAPLTNALRPGEVVRSIHLPDLALRARVAFRQLSLSPVGRSAALLIGRVDPDGSTVLTVTAATPAPVQLRFPALPTAAELDDAVATIDPWYDDPHGTPDWRRAISRRLAAEIRDELEQA